MRDVSGTSLTRRTVPKRILRLPVSARMKWARESAGLSHDRLIARMGRSNRGHAIKVEQGVHFPRRSLRDAWADATNVPRDVFDSDDDEESHQVVRDLMTVLRKVVREEMQAERV